MIDRHTRAQARLAGWTAHQTSRPLDHHQQQGWADDYQDEWENGWFYALGWTEYLMRRPTSAEVLVHSERRAGWRACAYADQQQIDQDEWQILPAWRHAAGTLAQMDGLPYDLTQHPQWQTGWYQQAGRQARLDEQPLDPAQHPQWIVGWGQHLGRQACLDGLHYDKMRGLAIREGWQYQAGRQAATNGLPYVPEKKANPHWRAGWRNRKGEQAYIAEQPLDPAQHPQWQAGWYQQAGAQSTEIPGIVRAECAHPNWQIGWRGRNRDAG